MSSKKPTTKRALAVEVPRTIDDLAATFGVPREELRRSLRLLHQEHGNVLFKASNKWLVSPSGLRRAWPGIGSAVPSPDEVESLRDEVAALNATVAALADKLHETRTRVGKKVGIAW